MTRLRVRGGLVVTPEGVVERDLIVADERIEALIDRGGEATAEAELDANGLVVLPGAVDGHIHFVVDDTDLFEPDPSEADEFEEGGRAAAAGGVTTIVEMPQAQPPTTDTQRFVRKRELGEPQAIVDFALWGGVVQGSDTTEIPRMLAEGAVGIKAFMCGSDPSYPGSDDAQLMRAMRELRDTPFMLGVHAENDALINDGIATMRSAGRRDPLAHAESRPPIVEIEAVNRAILLAEHTGAWVHIVHMSTAGAAELVAAAKTRGARVTCETCPQYLALDEDDLVRLGPMARCAPPIRAREHVEALWEYLADGTIDCVTTDHCGYSYESRLPGHEDIFEAPNGLPGVQTFLPVVITEARRRGFAWEDIARVIAQAPARLWRLAPRKGTIRVGADADLVLWDPDRRWTIRGADLAQRHKWTPFEGFEVTGRVVRTLQRGHTVYDESSGRPEFAPVGTGRFIAAIPPT
jgi:allantoinase